LPGQTESAGAGLEAEPLPAASGDLRQAVDAYQRRLIADCLQRQQGSWAAAARELGLDRANLNRLARRLGLR
jgi:anaerobic nitric oxide reductase transcription regulator